VRWANAGIAGRTNPPNFTGERNQKIITASITSNPGKPFGEDAAVHKATEAFLDIPWNTQAHKMASFGAVWPIAMLSSRPQWRDLQ